MENREFNMTENGCQSIVMGWINLVKYVVSYCISKLYKIVQLWVGFNQEVTPLSRVFNIEG